MSTPKPLIRRRLGRAGLVIALSWPLLLAASEAAADKPWCPVLRLAKTQTTPVGRCYQAWTEGLFARMGCTVELVDSGYANRGRRLEQFQRGELTVLIAMTRTPERDVIAHASLPYAQSTVRLYVRRGEAARWPVAAACDETMRRARLIGPTSGKLLQNYELELQAAGCLEQLEYYRVNTEQGAAMLVKERADILLMTETQWRRLPADQRGALEALPWHFKPDTLHLLFRKEGVPAVWVADFNKQLQANLDRHGPPCDTAPLTSSP